MVVGVRLILVLKLCIILMILGWIRFVDRYVVKLYKINVIGKNSVVVWWVKKCGIINNFLFGEF